MSILSNISVGKRIYSGFLTLLGLITAIAFVAFNNAETFQKNLTTYSRAASQKALIAEINASVIDVRRYIHRYVEAPSPETVQDVDKAVQRSLHLVDQASSHTLKTTEQAQIKQVRSAISAYHTSFQKLIAAAAVRGNELKSKNGIGKIGPELQLKLGSYMDEADQTGHQHNAYLAGKALESLMSARLYTGLFLGLPTEAYKKQAKQWMQTFIRRVDILQTADSAGAHQKELLTLKKNAARYSQSFDRVIQAVVDQDVIKREMGQFAGSVATLATVLNKKQTEIEHNISSHVTKEVVQNEAFTVTFASIALLFGILAAFFVSRSLTVPVKGMTSAMKYLAGGDLKVGVPALGQRSEIGQMADAVQVFKENAIRVKHLEAEQEEQKRRAEQERRAAMLQLADTFEESVGHVIETVTSAATELQASSEQMAATAEETSVQSTSVATASEQASANVQTVATSAEELSASIVEIGQQVQRSTEVSENAVLAAEETSEAFQELSDAVQQIGEIVSLITDIASQTNLLALNATIEAARAGDLGKGFAVVASEVKDLANQTARATGEISSQIQQVQNGTENAVSAISKISTVVRDIRDISSSIASAVEEQGAATSEIARNVEQAAQGTAAVSANIATVEQAAGDTGAAASQIRTSATDLSNQAEVLREEVNRFLAQVRAEKADMQLMEWDDRLITGSTMVDNEHRQMVDILNSAYADMMSGEGSEKSNQMIGSLHQLLCDHCRHEEDAMIKIGYPELELHQEKHMDLIERCDQLKARMVSGDKSAGMELLKFLANHLSHHTFQEDLDFIEFARQKGRHDVLCA